MKNFFEAFNDEIESELLDLENEEIEQEQSELQQVAENVMTAYQNANKWLDIIKEFLFTDLACVFFSSYVHDLAHTMPVRFDKFGDILHTIDMKVPYPATQYIPQEPTTVGEAFDEIFMILDAIKDSLNNFIKYTDEQYHGMACSAEALLNDIENEYVPLFKMKKAWTDYQDVMRFDKWVGQYAANRDKLNESLNEDAESVVPFDELEPEDITTKPPYVSDTAYKLFKLFRQQGIIK